MGKERFDLIVRAKDEASGVLKRISGSATAMFGAFAGGVAVTSFFKSSIDAAIESERVYNDLSASIERHGGVWKDVEKNVKAFTSTLQTQTGISDEAIARSTQMLIDMGNSGKEAFDLVRVAADLSAGANLSLASATDLIAKASVGYTATLSRYGIILDESIPASEKFAAAIEAINEKFSGAAQARTKTTWGQLQLLSQVFEDLQENVGTLVAGPLTTLIQAMNDLLTILNSNISGWIKFRTITSFLTGDVIDISTAMANAAAFSAELQAEQAKLAGEMENFGDKVGASGGAMTLTAESAKLLNDALKDQAALWRDINKARSEHLRRSRDYGAQVAEDVRQARIEAGEIQDRKPDTRLPTEILGIAEEGARLKEQYERELEGMQDKTLELGLFLESTMSNTIDNMMRMFEDGRLQLAEIFKGIAADFARYLGGKLIRNLAFRFADVLTGGGGSAVQTILGVAGSGKISTGEAMSASSGGMTTNVYIGSIIGEEEHVRQKVIPIIERAADLGGTRIRVGAGL